MNETAKKMDFRRQMYRQAWPTIYMSETALQKQEELEILYHGFKRAMNQTVLGLIGNQNADQVKVQVCEILGDNIPSGIKISFHQTDEAIFLADIWTPPQPQLF